MQPGARPWFRPAILLSVVCLASAGATACGGNLVRQYEYEEEIYLAVDGSASIYVNTSIPALVGLRGADLRTEPNARLDRNDIRALFTSPVTRVTRVSTWRRLGRQFVQVRLETDDITKLSQARMFAWSDYQVERRDDVLIYKQRIGSAAGKAVQDVGWRGTELVAIRLHLPSRIRFHNAGPDNLKRGNILVWEQTLADRQAGKPLEIEARMERTSILYSTLLLFLVSGGLALLVMATIVYWVVRKGRSQARHA